MSVYAASQITGTLGVEDVLQGKQIRDVSKGLYMIVDDNHLSPFVAVTAKNAISKGMVARNPKFEWTRKDIFPRWDTISGVTTASGAAIVVTPSHIDYYKVGDEIELPGLTITATQTRTGVITAKSTTITVSAVGFQSDGSTALVFPTVTTGMNIHLLSDASDEYSLMPGAKVVQDTQEHNFVQFLRVPYIIGNLENEMAQYTGSERAERRAETFREIKMSFEKVLLFGERGYVAGTTGRKYFSRGMRSSIEKAAGDNILDWSGGLTEAQLDDYLLSGPCKWGSQRKYWFMSTDLFLKVVELAKAKERIVSNKINSLGLAVLEYLAPNGKRLFLHQHYMFEEGYEGAGMIIDPDYVKIRPYGTQGTIKLHTEIQPNDAAGLADEWRVIAGLQVDRTEPHGYQHA